MSSSIPSDLDVCIVGGGMSGICIAQCIQSQCPNLSFRVFESSSQVGGTWSQNRFPGSRADIEALDYSFGLSEELVRKWRWKHRYATQSELQDYLNFVVDHFNLRSNFKLRSRIIKIEWQQQHNEKLWLVTVKDMASNRQYSLRAKYVVLAIGILSKPSIPILSGAENFQGKLIHASAWPEESKAPQLDSKRVAVIGTGSTGVLIVPAIADRVASLTVYQRTANYVLPIQQRILTDDELLDGHSQRRNQIKSSSIGMAFHFPTQSTFSVSDEERTRVYDSLWNDGGFALQHAFTDLMTNEKANETITQFFLTKLRQQISDEALYQKLAPKIPFGCKRLCFHSDYYRTFLRPNVELVDIQNEPIISVNEAGIVTEEQQREHDIIILATGFDAFTGAVGMIQILGRDSVDLKDVWTGKEGKGPQLAWGVFAPGFPNLFFLNGPGSPSVLSNVAFTTEIQCRFVASCIADSEAKQYQTVECRDRDSQMWMDKCQLYAEHSLFTRCGSWYLGTNIPGKRRQFLPFLAVQQYIQQLKNLESDQFHALTRN